MDCLRAPKRASTTRPNDYDHDDEHINNTLTQLPTLGYSDDDVDEMLLCKCGRGVARMVYR